MNRELKKITLLIDALPKDEAGLVKYLTELGIKGRTQNPAFCPLAQYFKSRGVESVSVTSRVASVADGSGEYVPLPTVLREFVMHFDKGNYSALTEY